LIGEVVFLGLVIVGFALVYLRLPRARRTPAVKAGVLGGALTCVFILVARLMQNLL
jgi:uncharacterized BrkB/YihY/UPF0761 family membrane protein